MHDVSRALLTALHRAAVQGADPLERTRDAVRAWCEAHGETLAASSRVHVIALGKAASAMLSGALQALDDASMPVAQALVVSTHAPPAAAFAFHAAQVTSCIGDHPVPFTASLDAADAIGEAVAAVESGDVAMVLLSGGTTALCAAPLSTFTQAVGSAERAQAHLANLAETLLDGGLAIHEMNAIRRRLLRWGAGRLAVALARRGAAAIPVFAVSDVIGDEPAVIGSGPCTPDPLADDQYLALVDAHGLRGLMERDMAHAMGIAGDSRVPAVPAATDPAFALVQYQLVARNADAVAALAEAARAAGIAHVHIDPAPLEGDAAALGERLAHRALQLAREVPRGTRALVVHGGEPTVHLTRTVTRAIAEADEAALLAEDETAIMPALHFDDDAPYASESVAMDDEPMRGGRMQLLALSFALALEGSPDRAAAARLSLLAAGTDGRDGPTDAAGAIVDAAVPPLARRGGRAPEQDARTGRSWYSLEAAGALLKTGPTGTNVMDVVAVYVG